MSKNPRKVHMKEPLDASWLAARPDDRETMHADIMVGVIGIHSEDEDVDDEDHEEPEHQPLDTLIENLQRQVPAESAEKVPSAVNALADAYADYRLGSPYGKDREDVESAATGQWGTKPQRKRMK